MNNSRNDGTTKMYGLRQAYLNLPINAKTDGDRIWVKKLQNILTTDIHSRPLGCKVEDTHVRIGKVHLGTFYEAQILFSHNYWVSRFADWLTDRILKVKETKKIVLIGYETYVEPVLYRIERKIKEKDEKKIVKYLIYEEKKYIQTDKTTNDSRIRYADEYKDDKKEETATDTLFVFICGISSTLKTFNEMTKKLHYENLGFQKNDYCVYYSIIQVLPTNYGEENEKRFFEFDDGKRLEWGRKDGVNKIDCLFDRTISAEFLADVYCEWQTAGKCKWCYPDVPIEERPIIETSETSVIPTQLIQEYRNEQVDINFEESKEGQGVTYEKSLNFFEKHDGYKYKKFLYYDHIDRDGHHYQYYFRTGHLFRKIFRDGNDKFKKDCEEMRRTLEKEDIENSVNVIVSPRHFSDGMFPQAINDYVFNKTAHIISLDIKKEYRSNFRTKYSNYAYFLDQVRGTDKKLNFYFVDDQIISGATFYRAKSLITSLMREYANDKCLNIFAGIFVLINRMSKETKRDYISDVNKFFSLIDIFIPSIRSYGDSCPICKLNKDAEKYQQKSALSSSAYHWSHRREHHRIKTLDDVKEQRKNENELSDRYFNRLAVENTLWGGFAEKGKKINGISDYQSKEEVLLFFSKAVNCNKYYESVELMISFIKAISRAFIYYRENAKKATLKILISFMQYLTENDSAAKGIIVDGVRFENISINSNYERYSLLVILVNALASVDSTYMLNADRILSIYNCVLDWQKDAEIYLCDKVQKCDKAQDKESGRGLCRFIDNSKYVLKWRVVEGGQIKEYPVESFYSVILNAYKRIICGISGEQKLNKFNLMLKEHSNRLYRDQINKRIIVCASEEDTEYLEKCELYNLTLLKAMMLESFNEIKNLDKEENQEDNDTVDKVKKYNSRAQALADKINIRSAENTLELTFYYYDASFGDYLIEMKGDASKRKLAEIFDSNNKIDNLAIKNSLLSNGFYHAPEKNKWMVDLRHFKSDSAAKNSSGSDEKYMCLLFEFRSKSEDDEEKKTFAQIEAVKNILKYRYWLTEDVDKDIGTGSIKSSIQAKKAKSLLDSDKILTHGKHADLTQILQTTYGVIEDCCANDNYDFVRICDMANSMMNMLISYANIHIVNEDYFAMDEEDGFFLSKVQHLDELKEDVSQRQKKLICQYFKEIADPKSKYLEHVVEKANRADANTIEINFYLANKGLRETESVEDGSNKIIMFPSMFYGARPVESCVFFIAIIDLFLRNAAKHGKSDDHKIKVDLNISELNSRDEIGYSLSLTNEKRKEASGGKNPITWKVLEYFSKLKNLKGRLDGFTIERTPPKEERAIPIFTATLSCKCKKEESPLLDLNILNNPSGGNKNG